VFSTAFEAPQIRHAPEPTPLNADRITSHAVEPASNLPTATLLGKETTFFGSAMN
jgi:hypothetical protein